MELSRQQKKNFGDMFNRFDTTPARVSPYKLIDRQSNNHPAFASCGKNQESTTAY